MKYGSSKTWRSLRLNNKLIELTEFEAEMNFLVLFRYFVIFLVCLLYPVGIHNLNGFISHRHTRLPGDDFPVHESDS